MKKYKSISIVLISLMFIVCCTKQETSADNDNIGYREEMMVFHAINGDYDGTKTALDGENGNIYWSASENIKVFYGATDLGKFTSTNTELAEKADFSGKASNFQYNDTSYFFAIYPYNYDSYSENGYTIVLSNTQTAVAGNMAEIEFPSVAKSRDNNLYFYNICGGIRFKIPSGAFPNQTVSCVQFQGINYESIAGARYIDIGADGKPTFASVNAKNDASSIVLGKWLKYSYEEMVTDEYYYINTFPTLLENGYCMILQMSDGTFKTIIHDKPLTIKRGIWGTISDEVISSAKDDYISFTFYDKGSVTFRLYSNPEGTQYEDISISGSKGDVKYLKPSMYGFRVYKNGEHVSSFDLSHWDSSRVKYAYRMFYGCRNMAELPDLSGLSQVTNAEGMFYDCSSIVDADISALVNLTGTADEMFRNCGSLENVIFPQSSTITSANRMFYGCESLKKIDVSCLENITDAQSMFVFCSSLTDVNVSCLKNVTNALSMFSGCSSLTTPLDISNMIELVNAKSMFSGTGITVTPDLRNLKKLENLEYMFNACTSLTKADISGPYNCEKISNINYIFNNCTAVTEIHFGDIDFSTSEDPYSEYKMFYNTSNLKKVTTTCLNELSLYRLELLLRYAHPYSVNKAEVITRTIEDGVATFSLEIEK